MVPANFISTQYIHGEFMTEARRRGVSVMAMKPFGGGRLSDARLCIKFLKQCPDVIPCVGIENAAEMRENLDHWEDDQELDERDYTKIERIRAELGDRFYRQCGYCQPCPDGIGIMTMNLMEAWAKQLTKEALGAVMSGLVDKARECAECGECVEKCPYDLPIPEMLKDNIAFFENAIK